jgi:hypothetical protein
MSFRSKPNLHRATVTPPPAGSPSPARLRAPAGGPEAAHDGAAASAPPAAAAGNRAVTPRAVLIGLVCAAALCAFTPYNDFKVAATYIAGTQFPIGAIFVLLFLVTAVNVPLRRFRPAAAFRRGELLTIWVLIAVASGLPSSGMMRYFIPHIVAPHYYSDATNNWEGKIWAAAPDWLKIQDQDAAKAFFVGYPRGQEHIPWAAWATPLFAWGILAALFLAATFCVASLLRRSGWRTRSSPSRW